MSGILSCAHATTKVAWSFAGCRDISRIPCTILEADERIDPILCAAVEHVLRSDREPHETYIAQKFLQRLNDFIPQKGKGSCLEMIHRGFLVSPEPHVRFVNRQYVIETLSGRVWQLQSLSHVKVSSAAEFAEKLWMSPEEIEARLSDSGSGPGSGLDTTATRDA